MVDYIKLNGDRTGVAHPDQGGVGYQPISQLQVLRVEINRFRIAVGQEERGCDYSEKEDVVVRLNSIPEQVAAGHPKDSGEDRVLAEEGAGEGEVHQQQAHLLHQSRAKQGFLR
jgi:hypothetical protein